MHVELPHSQKMVFGRRQKLVHFTYVQYTVQAGTSVKKARSVEILSNMALALKMME